MKRLMMTFGLVLALPLALAAQEHGNMERMHEGQGMHQQQGMHQGMGMAHGMMGGMHGMMMARPGPGMILRLQETLELTEDQVSELESMQTEAHESMQMHMQAAQEARTRAHEAMMGMDADMDAFQAGLEEAAQHQVQAAMTMARVHMQAGEVLTEEQTMKFHTLLQAMQEMHHDGMMGEGMEHGEGMGEMHGEGMMHEGMRSGG